MFRCWFNFSQSLARLERKWFSEDVYIVFIIEKLEIEINKLFVRGFDQSCESEFR